MYVIVRVYVVLVSDIVCYGQSCVLLIRIDVVWILIFLAPLRDERGRLLEAFRPQNSTEVRFIDEHSDSYKPTVHTYNPKSTRRIQLYQLNLDPSHHAVAVLLLLELGAMLLGGTGYLLITYDPTIPAPYQHSSYLPTNYCNLLTAYNSS